VTSSQHIYVVIWTDISYLVYVCACARAPTSGRGQSVDVCRHFKCCYFRFWCVTASIVVELQTSEYQDQPVNAIFIRNHCVPWESSEMHEAVFGHTSEFCKCTWLAVACCVTDIMSDIGTLNAAVFIRTIIFCFYNKYSFVASYHLIHRVTTETLRMKYMS
jgi:hypothetical protein